MQDDKSNGWSGDLWDSTDTGPEMRDDPWEEHRSMVPDRHDDPGKAVRNACRNKAVAALVLAIVSYVGGNLITVIIALILAGSGSKACKRAISDGADAGSWLALCRMAKVIAWLYLIFLLASIVFLSTVFVGMLQYSK